MITIKDLEFSYPKKKLFAGLDLELPAGALDDGRLELLLTVRERRRRREYSFDLELGATGVRHLALWRRGPLGRYGGREAEVLLRESLEERPGLTALLKELVCPTGLGSDLKVGVPQHRKRRLRLSAHSRDSHLVAGCGVP